MILLSEERSFILQSDKHLDEAIYRNIQTEYDGSPDSQNYFSKHMNAIHTTVSRV